MPWYTMALAIGAVIAACIAWSVPRAVLWVALASTSFMLSSVYWTFDGEYPALFGAVSDFIVAGLILRFAQEKWEIAIADCFGFMILVNLIWTANLVTSHYLYATTLELANWAALLVITARGLSERAWHGIPARGYLSRPVGSAYRYLSREARYPHWWKHS